MGASLQVQGTDDEMVQKKAIHTQFKAKVENSVDQGARSGCTHVDVQGP